MTPCHRGKAVPLVIRILRQRINQEKDPVLLLKLSAGWVFSSIFLLHLVVHGSLKQALAYPSGLDHFRGDLRSRKRFLFTTTVAAPNEPVVLVLPALSAGPSPFRSSRSSFPMPLAYHRSSSLRASAFRTSSRVSGLLFAHSQNQSCVGYTIHWPKIKRLRPHRWPDFVGPRGHHGLWLILTRKIHLRHTNWHSRGSQVAGMPPSRSTSSAASMVSPRRKLRTLCTRALRTYVWQV